MDDVTQDLVDEQAYSWLEMHKKSALSYLVLVALERHALWHKDLGDWITERTDWAITERGLYRLLRRMQAQGSITFTTIEAARTGAERKVYTLTPAGHALLRSMTNELKYLEKLGSSVL